MPRPVLYMFDMVLSITRASEYSIRKVYIRQVRTSANIVYLAGFSATQGDVYGLAVVLYKKPVPDVLPVAVKRHFLSVDKIGYKKRHHLLGILEWPEIVRTPQDDYR